MTWQQNDGGRSHYFKGRDVGDCVVRAVTIASGKDYKWVYDQLSAIQKRQDGKTARRGCVSQKPRIQRIYEKPGLLLDPNDESWPGLQSPLKRR